MPAYTPHLAKLVATPTESSWAQAYNAGALYAVLSLTTTKKTDGDLRILGKRVFGTLQSEFFPLEEKTLYGIKEAVTEAVTDLPKSVIVSFAVAYCKDDVLYVYIAGTGKVLLKRADALGVLLSATEKGDEVLSASGKVQDNDILILQTQQCTEVISEDSLAHGLEENITDSAEALMPQLQANEGGGAAALLLHFAKGPDQITEEEALYAIPVPKHQPDDELVSNDVPETSPRPETVPDKPLDQVSSPTSEQMAVTKTNPFAFLKKLGAKRVILGILAMSISVLLIGSVITVKQQQDNQKTKAAYEEVYSQAKDSYDKAEDLAGLNTAIARDEYVKAKDIIAKRINEFSAGSQERIKLDALLTQVNEALGPEDRGIEAKATAVADDTSPLLAIAKVSKSLFVTQDDDAIYYATTDGIFRQDDAKKDPKELITNDEDWSSIGGLSVYNGNVYLVDKPTGILKFVAGGSGYGKSSYFAADTKPSMKDAVSLAIDSSVWLLKKDGTVQKFTKGVANDFSLRDLPKPLVSPTHIFTNQETENLYILDRGASSVVVFAKDGTYVTSFTAAVLKNAKALDVSEANKKVYVLSGDKIWEFPLE